MSRALYQLASVRGLQPGTWVDINGAHDRVGLILCTEKEEYYLPNPCIMEYTVFRPDLNNLSLYLIRGRADDVPDGALMPTVAWTA